MLASGDVVLLVLGGAAVLVAVVLAATFAPGRRPSRPAPPAPEPITSEEEHMPLAAVVVNPTKVDDLQATRDTITRICAEHGWSEPLWLETTVDDTGAGQAREALSRGADVVMAHGGDGTVRAVAEVLAGSGTALGLLPAGTGNLLARNMDATLDDVSGSVRVALTGDDRPVDVGWMRFDEKGDERAFLVMAGFGFDAEIMANAPEGLKAKVGPAAYVVSGLARFNGPRVRVRLQIDDEEIVTRRVRTIVIGNCGKLLGGVVLMPDAELDDGILDVVSIAPTGVVGWAAVFGRVITRQRKGHKRVEHWRGKSMRFRAEQPLEAQLDGDPTGEATRLDVRVDPGALLVRVPVGGSGRGETRAGAAIKRAAEALVPDRVQGREG
jgi:diacylglycerol kinase family enzyme